eukprot:619825-Prymnesium_polylepis.1
MLGDTENVMCHIPCHSRLRLVDSRSFPHAETRTCALSKRVRYTHVPPSRVAARCPGWACALCAKTAHRVTCARGYCHT